jgi:hypothetical protein
MYLNAHRFIRKPVPTHRVAPQARQHKMAGFARWPEGMLFGAMR